MQLAASLDHATKTREMAKTGRPPVQITSTREVLDTAGRVELEVTNGTTISITEHASTAAARSHQPCGKQFTLFAKLPSELRYLIWREAYLQHLDAQPCVCIYQGGTISDDPDINGTKSTGGSGQRYNHSIPDVHPESFPLELVSREARTVCVTEHPAASETRPAGPGKSDHAQDGPSSSPVMLPSRVFDPETDTLYIDRRKRHGDGSTIVFYLGDRTRWVQHVKHIAIPFSIAIDIARHPSLLQHLKALEKISLVFPPARQALLSQDKLKVPRSANQTKTQWTTTLWSSLILPTPTRSQRIRLQPLSTTELNRLEIKDDPRRPSMLNGRPWSGGTASEFIELVKQSIGNRIRRTDQFSRGLQDFYWSKADGGFRLAVEGCVFV